MKISEAYEKLDRRLAVAISQKDTGIFKIISRLAGRIPVYLFHEDGGMYVQLFFSKAQPPKGNLSPILAREDLVEKTGYYAISEKMSNEGVMEGVFRIQKTDSVTMDDSFYLDGTLHLTFRFHSSVSKEINNILSDYISGEDSFRIIYLKGSESLKDRIMHIDSETPVSLVKYSLDLPGSLTALGAASNSGKNVVMEMRERDVFNEGIRVLLYSNEKPRIDGIKTISSNENIYELSVYEKTQVEARKKTNQLGIPRIAFFLTVEEGRLVDTTFLPTAEADEYVSVLFTLDERLLGSRPLLEQYEPVDESIWEWI